jgi:hypothetical protein
MPHIVAVVFALSVALCANTGVAFEYPQRALGVFLAKYADAFRQHDPAALEALAHPASRNCLREAASRWFEQEISLNPAPPPRDRNWTWNVMNWKSINPDKWPAAVFPVEPELAVSFSWPGQGSDAVYGALLALKFEGDRYAMIVPCPSAEQVQRRDEFFRTRRDKAAIDGLRENRLAPLVEPPSR